MKCDKCGRANMGHYYLQENREWWCQDCYPIGAVASYSPTEKIRTRVLAPDGRTVLHGREGQEFRRKVYGKA